MVSLPRASWPPTAYLFATIPKGFLPNEDTGHIVVFTEGAQDISFDAMVQKPAALAEIIARGPECAWLHVRRSAPAARGHGQHRPALHPPQAVSGSAADGRRDYPGAAPQAGRRAGHQGLSRRTCRPSASAASSPRASISTPCRTPTPTSCTEWAPILEAKLRTLPGFQDVTTDLQINNPQVNAGHRPRQGRSAGRHARPDRECAVERLRVTPGVHHLRAEQRVLGDPGAGAGIPARCLGPVPLYVRSSNGALVPLSTVARMTRGAGPLTVNHLGQLPAVTLSFNLRPGVSLGEAIDQIERVEERTEPARHAHRELPGRRPGFPSLPPGLGLLLLIAILVIYLVLGILYESFMHPLTMLSGLPSAGLGALLTLSVSPGSQHVRLRRHHHAGRHRQEERHHDDRLRARGTAPGRHDAAAGHLPRLPDPLPPHHDDHHGRPHGQPAHRARPGGGSETRAARWVSRWWAGCCSPRC